MSKRDINKLKSDVMKWSGFDLNGDTVEEMITSINYIQVQLEDEINQERKKFENKITDYFKLPKG